MNKWTRAALAVISMVALLSSCVSYNAYQRARTAEQTKNWDEAVIEYEKAMQVDPDNTRYRVSLERARLEASRVHFEKGKTLRAAAAALQITVKFDPTNQYAAVELGKSISFLQDAQRAREEATSIDEIKKRAA